jgi:iron complex outermembrane receptor protein
MRSKSLNFVNYFTEIVMFFKLRPPNLITLSMIAIGIVTPAIAQDTTTNIGTVVVTGEGDLLGNGLMIDDDSVKGKSTITRSAIEKERASINPFQLINLLPGVNASSHDATGLFGGNLRVRGFNSDQMGFTINGAPVNDSGNFAVYPQEYTDSENLCELFVTQGAAETDAPHVGASGGNVGLVSCSPEDKMGVRLSQSLGDLRFSKSFIRFDTGLMGTSNPIKAFISYSKAEVDKFKGYGGANRDHIDAGLDFKLTTDTKFSASLLYNKAVNHNYLTLTKNEFQTNPSLDYTSTIPQHLTSGSESGTSYFGTSSTSLTTPRSKLAYYGYSINPFENYLFTSRLQSRINDKLTLSAEPYFWYGYGTGGTQQTTLTEVASSSSKIKYGIGDINSNSVTSDVVGVYRGSVTQTSRPGITLKANYEINNHKILAGLWFERARHRQTQPGTTVDNYGNIGDIWLRNNLITYNNGDTYMGRNYFTISTGQSIFLTDTISFNNNRFEVIPGVRYTSINRDFYNYASSGTGMGADYNVSKTYAKLLPSLGARFKVDDSWQAFGNVTENMRAPSNFVQAGWVSGGTYSNGVLSGYSLIPNNSITKETATNYETGVRYGNRLVKASATVFQVDFKNRLSYAYNPDTATTTDYNVGSSRVRGLELQAGTTPVNGWSVFGSATYIDSIMLNDFKYSSTTTLATTGKTFPDTPKYMLGGSLQYTSGPFLSALSAKYNGKRYTTLMNDEYLDPYTVLDLSMAYRFSSNAFIKKPTIRLNVSNLFNEKYLQANSGSGSNITTTTDTSVSGYGTPTYYVGAPRFTSIAFSTEF